MEILSQRNIHAKLLLLRLIGISLIIVITWLFIANHADYALLAIIIFLVGLTISVNQVVIYNDRVIVSSYYVFGFIAINHCLDVNNMLTMTAYEDYYEFDNDVLFDLNIGIGLIDLFLPRYKMVHKYTEFNYTDKHNTVKHLTTKLRETEFKLAWKVLNGQLP